MTSIDDVQARALSLLEEAIDDEAPGFADSDVLAARARELSRGFTEDRHRRDTPHLDAEGRLAYLAYFAPRTIAALAHVYRRIARPTAIAMDVGAGTGASTLFLACLGVRIIHAVDHDERALARARLLARRASRDLEIVLHPGTRIPDLKVGDMLLSFSLSELAQGDAALRREAHERVLARAFSRLVVVDGGDRTAARNISELRERAIASSMGVLFPCPHDEPCPALARASDWCHLRTTRRLTPKLARFAARVGRDPEHMAFMGLVAAREATTTRRSELLVLGAPHVEKGRVRLTVCGAGTRTVQALARHRDVVEVLTRVEPGMMLVADGEARGETLHVRAPPTLVEDDAPSERSTP